MRAGYSGDIIGVNPRHEEVQGHPCYPSVQEVPRVSDVALIAVGGQRAVEAVQSCGEAGVPFAIVFAAGFAESGSSGRKLEYQLRKVATRSGIRVLGPNTLGVLCPDARFVGSFASAFEDSQDMHTGRVGFVSQSGALGAFIYGQSRHEAIDFAYWVSTGNEVDLSFSDFVEFMADDPSISVIAGYLEGVTDGRRLASALASARESGKELILLKSGRSEVGRSATMSHTASIAGPDAVYESVFRDLGVVRAHDPQELLDFSRIALAPRRNDEREVAIITISGGVGAWMSDAFDSAGVSLAKLTSATQERLREVLPTFARFENPVDLTGQILNEPGLLGACVRAILSQDNLGYLVIALGLQESLGKNLAQDVLSAVQEHQEHGGAVDCVVAWMAGPQAALSILREGNIPTFTDFGRCVSSVSALLGRSTVNSGVGDFAARASTISTNLGPPLPQGEGLLDEASSKRILAEWGIPFPEGVVVRTVGGAVSAAQRLGYPVVVKGVSAAAIHKSERGLVRTDLYSERDVRAAAEDMLKRSGPIQLQLLIERMVDPGLEVVVGANVDEVFGPILLFGAGGVLVHLLEDQAIKMLPISRADAQAMIEETRIGELLGGYRGSEPLDTEGLIGIMLKLGAFVVRNQESLISAELNPVIVDAAGCTAVDAAIFRGTGDTSRGGQD
jgi:acetate---CoA ligase (ADP-forming)